MQAQTAIHDTANAAAEALGAAGAKRKKKGSTLAGLFSELLSQAQKGALAKPGEGAKAASRLQGEGRSVGHARPATVRLAKAPTPEPIKSPHSAPTIHAEKASVKETPERVDDQAIKARGKRGLGAASSGPEAEAPEAAVRDDRRRTKDAREGSAEEAAAIRAAMAAAKAPSAGAAAPKAKGPHEADERDASVEAGKKAERSSSEPKVAVLDLRRSAESKRQASAKPEASAQAEDGVKEASREAKAGGQGTGRELVRELSLDARPAGEAPAAPKAEGAAAAGGRDFSALLAERMREAWNGEIVKSAHIVLRDGDAGTIRLRLRPESLGNVKVELNLTDNNISGRITVESDEAKSAFERNMNELADAFKQGGFDSARLEVAVGGSGTGAGGSGANPEGSAGPFYSERLRSAVLSSADPAAAASVYARRGGAVDILA